MSDAWSILGFDEEAFEGFAVSDARVKFGGLWGELGVSEGDVLWLGGDGSWVWKGSCVVCFVRLVEIFAGGLGDVGDFVQMRVGGSEWLWVLRGDGGILAGLSEGAQGLEKIASVREIWGNWEKKGG